MAKNSVKTAKEAEVFKKMNPVVRFLTISDIMMLGGFALVSPIFAVFVTNQVAGGSIEVVGIAEGIYLTVRSLMQMPFGRLIDKIKGERDDFWFMLIGSILLAMIPIFYIFCDTPIKLYAVQFLYGLLSAATLPTWLAIFTRHIDRNQEGAEWGVYQTAAGLSSAACASLGGFLAVKYGFASLFITVSILCFTGSLFLIGIYRHMRMGGVLRKKR
jgi:MFS family permease